MKALEIDPDERVAWAETGLTAGEVTNAAGAHGLAIRLRRHRLGRDRRPHARRRHRLPRAQARADDRRPARRRGRDRRRPRCCDVDAEHDPDLFWAIRGGGGNFGVATRFELPAAPGRHGHSAACSSCPRRAESSRASSPRPRPRPRSSRRSPTSCLRRRCRSPAGARTASSWCSRCSSTPVRWTSGERAVAPFRALATPLADMVRPMPYSEMSTHPRIRGFRPRAAARTMFLDAVDDAVAETILEPPRGLDGDDARRAAARARRRARARSGATPPRSRTGRAGSWSTSPRSTGIPTRLRSTRPGRRTRSTALRQTDTGAYVNFLGDEGEERVRAAYPGATWERLARGQAPLRPGQPVPAQPEHPAGDPLR